MLNISFILHKNNIMKVCSKCKEEKLFSEFHKGKQNKDGYNGSCKECNKKYNKEYYKKNNKQISIQGKKYRNKNVEKIKRRSEEYYKKNKKQINEYNRFKWSKYYENNKESIIQKNKEYRKNNIVEFNSYTRKYNKKRRKIDSLYKMKTNLRTRTRAAFKAKSWSKNNTTQKMLGCDFETAHKHLEKQFIKGMNWNNQGEWHIDHIIPLASAQTESELIKLCHYTNLQPLWAIDNLIKGATMPNVQTQLRI